MVTAEYDAVIIGSGFGGSVTAYRLAEAKQRVCVLERGKEYPPGSFARRPHEMRWNFWDPSEGGYGLFNIWSFGGRGGLGAVVSSGLGGGSLIYANVLIRKDERWFVREDPGSPGYEYWPVQRTDLDSHYDCVEKMLGAQSYPHAHAPYRDTPKTNAFIQAAEALNQEWFFPKLAVTFGNPGETPVPGEPIWEEHRNMFNRTRYTCRLCGECDIGCNYGSKNTLDYTYLSAAKRCGAEIRTLSEVRAFEPLPEGGFSVHYIQHNPSRQGQQMDTADHALFPRKTVTCRRLVLAAGTLGTTYLLLKNRSAFPRISRRLGERFCTNGDLLAFAKESTHDDGGVRRPRVISPSYGPVITTTVRVPDTADGGDGRGFYLQDAGYPYFADWLLQTTGLPSTILKWRSVASRIVRQRLTGNPDPDLGAEIFGLIGTSELSAGSMPMLGMGRDIPDGVMRLRKGKLNVDWHIAASERYFGRVRTLMMKMTEQFGAKFQDNPLFWYLNRVLTVHPLGGCSMGRDVTEGVVDSWGEIYNYPGLFVVDGAVMPGPVGANPSLTIAALANRFASRMVNG